MAPPHEKTGQAFLPPALPGVPFHHRRISLVRLFPKRHEDYLLHVAIQPRQMGQNFPHGDLRGFA